MASLRGGGVDLRTTLGEWKADAEADGAGRQGRRRGHASTPSFVDRHSPLIARTYNGASPSEAPPCPASS